MAKYRTVKFIDVEPRIIWNKMEPIIVDDELKAFKCGEFRFAPSAKGFDISEEEQ